MSRTPETTASSQHIYWKMAFIFPSENKLTERECDIVEWIYHKLHYQAQNKQEACHTPLSPSEIKPQTLTLSSTPLLSRLGGVAAETEDNESTAGRSKQLCLAIKGLCDAALGNKDDEITRELCGTCAIALFLPTPHLDQTAEVGQVHVRSYV